MLGTLLDILLAPTDRRRRGYSLLTAQNGVSSKKFHFLFQLFFRLAFRHAGACLTLLYNTVEESLRGMKE